MNSWLSSCFSRRRGPAAWLGERVSQRPLETARWFLDTRRVGTEEYQCAHTHTRGHACTHRRHATRLSGDSAQPGLDSRHPCTTPTFSGRMRILKETCFYKDTLRGPGSCSEGHRGRGEGAWRPRLGSSPSDKTGDTICPLICPLGRHLLSSGAGGLAGAAGIRLERRWPGPLLCVLVRNPRVRSCFSFQPRQRAPHAHAPKPRP